MIFKLYFPDTDRVLQMQRKFKRYMVQNIILLYY
jgi:hypothetical protein